MPLITKNEGAEIGRPGMLSSWRRIGFDGAGEPGICDSRIERAAELERAAGACRSRSSRDIGRPCVLSEAANGPRAGIGRHGIGSHLPIDDCLDHDPMTSANQVADEGRRRMSTV